MAAETNRTPLRVAMKAARAGDRDKARALLAEYTQKQPHDVLGWLWRAGCAQSAELALVWIRQLLERDPDHVAGLNALDAVLPKAAFAAMEANDKPTARKLFREIAAEHPHSPLPWLGLAQLAERPGDRIRHLEEVLRIDPEQAGAAALLEKLKADAPPTAPPAPAPTPARPKAEAFPAPSPLTAPEEAPRPLSPEPEPKRGTYGPASFVEIDGIDLPEVASGDGNVVVMIVDDNPAVRDFVCRQLEPLGIRVQSAGDASSAVVQIRDEGVPHLILIDAEMPEIDGFQLCKYLRQNDELSQVPIVLLSRKEGWLGRLRGLMAGFNESVGKPVSAYDLRHLVLKHCPSMRPALAAQEASA